MITATNKATGELVELETDTPEQIVQAWQIAQEYVKTAESLKDQLKKLVPNLINESKGISDQYGNYIFRRSVVQRMTYDKAVVRNVLDEDTYDLVTKVDKTALDRFLKDNLAELGDKSHELRTAMIPEGNAFEVIKLEKVSRA